MQHDDATAPYSNALDTDRWTALYGRSMHDLHAMPPAERDEMALEGVRTRFATLVDRLPVLKRLAAEQGVSEIRSLDDLPKLFFQHSVYKSYPLSFIEKAQFDRLTKWLSGLTTVDLSGLDASGIETIDDWIDLLDRETPIRIIHSSGTSGKLSFLPRSIAETDLMIEGWRLIHQEFSGPGADLGAIDEVPIIFPSYRSGAMAQHRMLGRMIDTIFKGDPSMLLTLNDGRMSADALSLGGRLQAAGQKGELGEIQLSPKLIARRDEFLRNIKEGPARTRAFFDSVGTEYRGRRIGIMASLGQLLDIALAARDKGLTRLFAPDSLVMVGGGWKGRTPPEDWREIMTEFIGVDEIRDGYGMTECIAATRSCEQGNYHFHPFQIPFLLDHETGDPKQREGVKTGRLGVFDLGATTYWGGFLTGDEVTLSFEPCGCGRTSPFLLAGHIRRYSEQEGGDDKITCAGAPEAHDNALAYLLESVEA